MWGDTEQQQHYRQGRTLQEVKLSDIEGVCKCGYLTLKPNGDFEQHHGGLTVKRSQVRIVRDDGTEVKQLRGKDIMRWFSCNACANNWK